VEGEALANPAVWLVLPAQPDQALYGRDMYCACFEPLHAYAVNTMCKVELLPILLPCEQGDVCTLKFRVWPGNDCRCDVIIFPLVPAYLT
jgi:hypothetical protein